MKPPERWIFLFVLLLMLSTCNEQFTDKGIQIRLLKTEFGGCQDSTELDRTTENYFPYYSAISTYLDTLVIRVGIDYSCCTSLISSVDMLNDTIFMTLEDMCRYSEESSYCRCMCWYTWNYYFVDYKDHQYFYRVILIDPREEQAQTVGLGEFRMWN
jgi:hypothetical protein